MKILALLATVVTLAGCGGDNGFGLTTDCSSEGKQKPISFDNGAGPTWKRVNTSNWCDPRGGMPVAEDPTFEPKH